MNTDLNRLDPEWAWSPYSADAERPWNRTRAAHLFRRAGFAASSQELDEAIRSQPAEVVARLGAGLSQSVPTDAQAFRDELATLTQSILATGDPKDLSAAWVFGLLRTPEQLREKTTLFWHGHFASSAEKVQDPHLMLNQIELLRRNAFGNFGELVQQVSRDPAMLIYLDSATNRKAHPNENYAREVLELFCLGEGNYSEKDIQELARCFTGWEVKNRKFRFNRFQHDSGSKSVFGKTGEFGGEQGVQIVLEQPALPRFIVGKLMRYFLFDEPRPPAALIEPLAVQFRENGLQIGSIIERMLASNLFFSPHALGRKVRSPVEFAVGLLRALEATTDAGSLAEELANLGQGLYYPPNVKGWDGGRTWINSSTLLGRANLIRSLLANSKTRFAGADLATFVHKHNVDRPDQLVPWLEELLFAVPLAAPARERLVQLFERTAGDPNTKIRELLHAMCALPEFQLA